ncbi:hypothetical protein MMC19_004478 [Ptychographa xylographoides]|nr:hypothetical protein [Ptychographa xylographoides]
MFSYLHGIRPSARRAASSQVTSQNQAESFGRETDEGANIVGHRNYSRSTLNNLPLDGSFSRSTGSLPPSLPPIPRVASQYGAQGGVPVLGEDRLEDKNTIREPRIQSTDQDGAYFYGKRLNADNSETGDHETCAEYNLPISVPIQSTDHSPSKIHQWPNIQAATSHALPFSGENSGIYRRGSDLQSLTSSASQNVQSTNNNPLETRHGRPRLNLLNPMSILARRRSAQTAAQANDSNYSKGGHASFTGSRLPDNYDPRIRGKGVHDFSASRPRPTVSHRESGWAERQSIHNSELKEENGIDETHFSSNGDRSHPRMSPHVPRGSNSQTSERQRTPVFKEQFGAELEPWRFDDNDRRNQHTTGLLDRMPVEYPGLTDISLPPFARSFPPSLAKTLPVQGTTTLPPKALPPLPQDSDHAVPISLPGQVPNNVTATTPPPKAQSRTPSLTDIATQSPGLPKHFKSNASRFSFDLAGVGSAAQEKLLEEKHRQKNSRRTRNSTSSRLSITASSTGGLDEDDDLAYNDIDDGQLLEEMIPGVNADIEEESEPEHDESTRTLNFSLPRYTHVNGSNGTSNVYLNHFEDLQGRNHGLGTAQSYQFVNGTQQGHALSTSNLENNHDNSLTQVPENTHPSSQSLTHLLSDQLILKPKQSIYQDELYFDDGMIDDFNEEDGPAFDETVFDDETSRIYGLPLRDLRPLPITLESFSADTSQQSTRPISAESENKSHHINPETKVDLDRISMPPPGPLPIRKSSVIMESGSKGGPSLPDHLTQDNLAAYHTALANAADRAARDGRFNRKPSLDEHGSWETIVEGQQSRVSFDKLPVINRDLGSDLGDFNFEDDQEDDAIIAAANAEALENDDEGFYGQEFGFFAHANGFGEVQYANGGYFGPAGLDQLKRSHSGKADFQEPSLTPITERSEWSQRNSMVSLAIQSVYSPSLPTPGLAQLADAMQYEDDNMSLSALLKLRRGAFGGSNGSLRSSGSHKSVSPQTLLQQAPAVALTYGLSGSNLAGSSYSLATNSDVSSDADKSSSSPTLTLQTQGLTMLVPSLPYDSSAGSDSSPQRRKATRGLGHSRNSSGADSVSYIKELDEDGAGRWVLEKRRTIENGQVEILGRQIVEGGRI